MEKKLNDIEINIEVIPIYTFIGCKNIIKLSDFAYGEWLIYKSNKPVYYINIFDSDFKELKTLLESKKTSIDDFIKQVNIANNETLSLKQNYYGITVYSRRIPQKITISKFPESLLNMIIH